jgi:NH3-dependent NAD+ synthetase
VWAAGGAAALLVALVALFVLRPRDPLADPRPVAQVQGFVAAMEARDATAMLSFVEPSVLKKQIGPEVRAYVEYIRELRFEDARYELLQSDGERARVRMTATMQYTLDYGDLRSGTHAVDSIYELRLVEGTWYISGVELPQA